MARAIVTLIGLLLVSTAGATRAVDFQVIAYHDVRDVVRDAVDPDQYAISTRNLIDHFTWLRINGFVPVSVDDIIRARNGAAPLPEKAVLLTFDDGFRSVYTHVYPLLRLFGYPAVVSVVTAWVNGDAVPPADDATLANHQFVTWDELREMRASGLVEIASHSHDLHHGIAANPFGNEQPAGNTIWFRDGRYETVNEYRARIRADLEHSADLIETQVGRRPRVMTWPYGAYTLPGVEVAAGLGMPITLTLSDAPNALDDLTAVSRHLIQSNPKVIRLGFDLLHEDTPPAVRAAQVDLDYVYDPDVEQQEENLSALLDRIKALEISHVFLQAFADPDADGGAQALYFPNRHLPVRADLFNRALWQLRTRANVEVYAWLPILSFDGPDIDPRLRVVQQIDGQRIADADSEPRLSPFSPEARRIIREIYEDLAISAPVAGILFHDDGRLNEFEDASDPALRFYRRQIGNDFTIESTFDDPELQRRWAAIKTRAIVDLTDELTATVRRYRPSAKTARNLFSATLLDPDGETYLAQNFGLFAASYDHIALMAMPYFENARNPIAYFEALVNTVAHYPGGREKTIFELQTVDWSTDVPLPGIELRATLRWLQSIGIKHLAYYPDDFVNGIPNVSDLRQGMSLARFPLQVPK